MRSESARSDENPAPWRRLALLWKTVWCVLAVLHVTQAIWRSGWSDYPGDLGDARFNNLVLEHGYRSLQGAYAWSTPGQFHPVQGTLAYSDTLAGTLPIYIAARVGGAAPERAFQWWFVIVAALNAGALWRLLSVLRVADAIAGPAIFLGSSSAVMVWYAGTHAQMLAIFPALAALEQAVRWFDNRSPRHIVAGVGWLAWQFAASPYVAFFAGVLGTSMVGLSAWLGPKPVREYAAAAGQTTGRGWLRAGLVAAFGGAMFVLAAIVYVRGVREGHSRAVSELVELAPDWRSWFTAPPIHAFFAPGWPARHPDLVENGLFSGFLSWLALPFALIVGWRARRERAGAWMLALAGGAIIGVAVFSKAGSSQNGVLLFLARHLEILGAFRAAGRVSVLVQPLLVIAAALLLTRWWLAVGDGAWRRALPLACTVIAAVEGSASSQPRASVAVAQARAEALVAEWRKAGDRPMLAFAPGFGDYDPGLAHLDAWSAALRTKRRTINGASGGAPGSHRSFLWSPTVEKLEALIAELKLPRDEISIVESWGAELEAQLGIVRHALRPVAQLEGFELQPVWWQLFVAVETWKIDGVTGHQFTPPAEAHFAVPDGATRVAVQIAFRPGAYSLSGNSDGVGVTWALRAADGAEQVVWQEVINPRDRPEHRGWVSVEFALPPGERRTLVLRTDFGPAGDGAWDWPVFARLRAW